MAEFAEEAVRVWFFTVSYDFWSGTLESSV